MKMNWRFMDFAKFCMIFGAGKIEVKAGTLCEMYRLLAAGNSPDEGSVELYTLYQLQRLVYLLAG